jgi:hypothetical protein
VRVYIDRRFMQPLRSARLQKEKHIFSTRVESLANSVIKNCADTDTAVQIVKEARNIEKQIFEENIEMKSDQQEVYKRSMFRALVYKVGSIDMGICCNCCTRSFKTKGIADAMSFTKRMYITTLGLMAC